MAATATTDLCDRHETDVLAGVVQLMRPGLLAFGQRTHFQGQAATLKIFEDNTSLAQIVKSPGKGRVLLVDAGESLRCAVLGGNLAQTAAENSWSGIVIAGAVRDADELDACALGIRALGVCPRRSIKRAEGEAEIRIALLGVVAVPGDWVYADRDGVIVAPRPLHLCRS